MYSIESNFARQWAAKKIFIVDKVAAESVEPPALPIDIVIVVLAIGVMLGALVA